MLIDDVQSDIMRELARIHKRKMAPLKKALESAIVRAAKTDCWYDPWNRKGVRADYGTLKVGLQIWMWRRVGMNESLSCGGAPLFVARPWRDTYRLRKLLWLWEG